MAITLSVWVSEVLQKPHYFQTFGPNITAQQLNTVDFHNYEALCKYTYSKYYISQPRLATIVCTVHVLTCAYVMSSLIYLCYPHCRLWQVSPPWVVGQTDHV